MSKKVSFRINFDAEDAKEYRAITMIEQEAKDRRAALIKKHEAHQDIKVAVKLTHYTSRPKLSLGQSGVTVDFYVHETPDENKPISVSHPASVPAVYMDPKVLNSLLHGQMLSDDEKRELLARTHDGLRELFKKADKPA